MDSAQRIELITIAESKLGAPYVWGAKGDKYFDCSGFVTWCLDQVDFKWPQLFSLSELVDNKIAAGNWKNFCNADRLYRRLKPTDFPVPMDLAFYGRKGHANHVVFCFGDGRVIGACGGNSSTTAPIKSAFVKFRPSAQYRKDFLGYRSLP